MAFGCHFQAKLACAFGGVAVDRRHRVELRVATREGPGRAVVDQPVEVEDPVAGQRQRAVGADSA